MADRPSISPKVGIGPRRIIRFAFFCLIAALWTCGGGASAEDSASALQRKYRRLQGEEAIRFLIGNSLMDPPGPEEDVVYFINDSTVMTGYKGGPDCTIYPPEPDEDKNCPRNPRRRCEEFHVMAAKSALTAPPKPGAFIGYYVTGNGGEPKRESSYIKNGDGAKIFAGNLTRCPTAKQPTEVQALEIPATDKSVPDEVVGPPVPEETGSPGALLEKFLVGNSIVWPKNKDDQNRCGMVHYFGRDGRIYILTCQYEASFSPQFSFHSVAGRWKRIGAQVCLDSRRGAFEDCDGFVLKAFKAETGASAAAKRLHVFFANALGYDYENGYGKEAGLLVKGNPAAFAFH